MRFLWEKGLRLYLAPKSINANIEMSEVNLFKESILNTYTQILQIPKEYVIIAFI